MKSTFKILFYLKKNEPKKNGNVTIMIRITVNGSNTQFSSKLDIHPDNRDVSKGQAKTGKGYSVENTKPKPPNRKHKSRAYRSLQPSNEHQRLCPSRT